MPPTAAVNQRYSGRPHLVMSSKKSSTSPGSSAEVRSFSSKNVSCITQKTKDTNPQGSKSTLNEGTDDDDFSYAKLSKMWKQKDTEKLKIIPPTPRTPLMFSTASKPHAPQSYRKNDQSDRATAHWKKQEDDALPPVASQVQRFDIEHIPSDTVDTSIVDDDITLNLSKLQSNAPLGEHVIESSLKEDEESNVLKPRRLWKQKTDTPEKSEINPSSIFLSDLPKAGIDSNKDNDSEDDEEMERIMKAQMKYHVNQQEKKVSHEFSLKSLQNRALSNFQLNGATNHKILPMAPKKPPKPSSALHLPPKNTGSTSSHISKSSLHQTIDPYERYDSMSMINSEVTVQVENKQTNNLLNSLSKRTEILISDDLNDQYDMDSLISDSAFGITPEVLHKLTISTKNVRGATNQHNADIGFRSQFADEGSNECQHLPSMNDIGALYSAVPIAQQVAESDVFDGLSDVMQPTVTLLRSPPLDLLKIEREKTHSEDHLKNARSDDPIDSLNISKLTGIKTSKTRPSVMERERNEEAKKRFTENLAAFAKNNNTRQKNTEKLHLNFSKPSTTTKRSRASPFKPKKSFTNTLESVGEHDRHYDDDETSKESDESSEYCTLGISKYDDDNTVQSSRYLDDFITPERKDFDQNTESSIPIQLESSESITQENVNGSKESNHPSGTEDDYIDAQSKISWVPSVLRLYEMQDFKQPQAQMSPTSTIDFNQKIAHHDKISIEECLLSGPQSILLCRNPIFGGTIRNSSQIISNVAIEMNKSFFERLNVFNKDAYMRHQSRIQGQDPSMFEKMAEIHESALRHVYENDLDKATELYESFFVSYSNHEFTIQDRGTEKQIIAAILYNMGMIYLSLNECELALDFFKEARATFEDIEIERWYHYEVGTIYNAIGVAQFGCGEYDKALMMLADSLAIRQECGDKLGMLESLSNIACTFFALDDTTAANESMEEALEVSRSYCKSSFTKDQSYDTFHIERVLASTADVLCNMSYVYYAMGSTTASRYLLEESQSIYKCIESRCELHGIITNFKCCLDIATPEMNLCEL